MRYVRFVVGSSDRDSQVRQGIFQALCALQDEDALTAAELARWRELIRWFNANLPRPARFNTNRARYYGRAICWFKDTAGEQIGNAREMVELLRDHGIVVHKLSTHRPGYVVYEDKWQVVAEPFRDTGA